MPQVSKGLDFTHLASQIGKDLARVLDCRKS